MSEMFFVGLCGSLRKQSRNMGLLHKAQQLMPFGSRLEIVPVGDLPFYNADMAEKPDSVRKLVALGNKATGYVFACPEYNYSLAPALKNAIDWLSREPNLAPFSGKVAAIMGAGGGMGTSRSQMQLRQVCVYLNLHLLNKPELFSNAFSDEFNADGDVASSSLEARVGKMMQTLVEFAKIIENGRSLLASH